jgi:hypothetical protein
LVTGSCIGVEVSGTYYDTGRRTCRDSYLVTSCLEVDREERESAWDGNRPCHENAYLDPLVTLRFEVHHIVHLGLQALSHPWYSRAIVSAGELHCWSVVPPFSCYVEAWRFPSLLLSVRIHVKKTHFTHASSYHALPDLALCPTPVDMIRSPRTGRSRMLA